MFDSKNIPSQHYDLKASMALMANRESTVRELALMLKDTLPSFKKSLDIAIQTNNIAEIQTVAHKIHGSVCYVKSPRLEFLVEHLESACKQQHQDISLITPYMIPSIDALEQALRQHFT